MRVEDGEVLHEMIENFVEEMGIKAAAILVIGSIGKGSKLVVGPKDADTRPVVPMEHVLNEVHEIYGVGTVFPNEEGRPISHIHISGGRGTSTKTGCIRRGVRVWQVAEVVIIELLGTNSKRRIDDKTGFELLDPG
jgi:predicted DNA-binding protein with PD1-like motif